MAYTHLHKHHHDDYEVAKSHIHRQIGRLDLELFGRQILCAMYIRPPINPKTGWVITDKKQQPLSGCNNSIEQPDFDLAPSKCSGRRHRKPSYGRRSLCRIILTFPAG